MQSLVIAVEHACAPEIVARVCIYDRASGEGARYANSAIVAQLTHDEAQQLVLGHALIGFPKTFDGSKLRADIVVLRVVMKPVLYARIAKVVVAEFLSHPVLHGHIAATVLEVAEYARKHSLPVIGSVLANGRVDVKRGFIH